MVPKLKKLSYEQRLEYLGLWTLEERRNRADLLEVFKMFKGLSATHSLMTSLFCKLLRVLEDIQPNSWKTDAD